MRVRDDPLHPDPGFAELYASLPDAADLWPWLDWCQDAEPPVLYLGIGAGRLAVPLSRAGIEIVGVDAHPLMLDHLRRRMPEMQTHQGVLQTLDLGRGFDLVIGPSSILGEAANLTAAVRHVRPGGRVGMELMNPRWLTTTSHDGVRLGTAPDGSTFMEVDYRRRDGSVVVQVVDDWKPGPSPEEMKKRLGDLGLDVLWVGPRPDATLSDTPTFYVLAGLPAG